MRRWVGVALAAGLFVWAVVVPPEPWGPLAGLFSLATLATGVAVAQALRAEGAPRTPSLRAISRALLAACVLAALHFAIPAWGIAASFLADPTRRDALSTSVLLAATLILLIFVTGEHDDVRPATSGRQD